HQERAHHEVVVEEAPGVRAVCADAPDAGRQVDHDVRPRRLVELTDRRLLDEIHVVAPRDRDALASGRPETLHHPESEEAGPTRHQHPLASYIQHGAAILARCRAAPGESATDGLEGPPPLAEESGKVWSDLDVVDGEVSTPRRFDLQGDRRRQAV